MLVHVSAFHCSCHLLPKGSVWSVPPTSPCRGPLLTWPHHRCLIHWNLWLDGTIDCGSIIDHSFYLLPAPSAHPQGNLQGMPSLPFCWFSLAWLPSITGGDPQGAFRQDFKPVQHIRFFTLNHFFSLLISKHHFASFWFSLAPKNTLQLHIPKYRNNKGNVSTHFPNVYDPLLVWLLNIAHSNWQSNKQASRRRASGVESRLVSGCILLGFYWWVVGMNI